MSGDEEGTPISRRGVLATSLLGLAACSTPQPPQPDPVPEEPPPPDPHEPVLNGNPPRNVVVIFTDDQRWDGLSLESKFLHTPHLDRMATEGVQFERAYVTTSLCCPSRATLLTGLYAHQHGVLNNLTEVHPSFPTIATLAERAGVETAYIGKWHMGADTAEPRPGWSRWVSFPGQGHYFYPGPEQRRKPERGFNVDGGFTEVKGYVTDLITDYAVSFLEERDREKPFLMVVGHKACHAPFEPAPRHREALMDAEIPPPLPEDSKEFSRLPDWLKELRKSLFGVEKLYNGRWKDFESWYRDYHRTLLSVDEGVGRILSKLAELGDLENTVVMFTSDNGFMLGEKGVLDKRSFYEPSVRIPWLAMGGGVVAQKRSELVTNVDWAPTILDILGVKPPESMQGESTWGMLKGLNPKWRDAFLYEYFYERQFPDFPTMIGVRTNTAKLVTYHGIAAHDEFYDLVNDPHETKNLRKDPAWAQRRKMLWRRLRQLQTRHGLLLAPVWGTEHTDEDRKARFARPGRGKK